MRVLITEFRVTNRGVVEILFSGPGTVRGVIPPGGGISTPFTTNGAYTFTINGANITTVNLSAGSMNISNGASIGGEGDIHITTTMISS